MSKVTFSEFDHNYFYSEKRTSSAGDYLLHNIDVFNDLEFKGEKLTAVYQTGCSYFNGDYSCPSENIELSENGGASKTLCIINQMCESDFDNDDFVEHYLEECDSQNVKNKDDLFALYCAINENLIQAQSYFDSVIEDIEPDFLES